MTRARHHARLRDSLRVHPARLLLGVLVTVGITAVVLAVPVVSGKVSDPAPVALDSSASAARASTGSPVVMGEDGVPVPSSTVSGGTSGRPAGSGSAGTARTAAGTAAGTAGGTAASSAQSDRAGGPGSSAAQSPGSSLARPKAAPGAAHSPTTTTGTSSSSNGLTGSPGTASTGSSNSGLPAAAAPATGTVASDAAEQVLALVNADRANRGCDPLQLDSALTAAATVHSAAMRDGSGPDQAVAAVAQGTSDPAQVAAGWLADSPALLECTRNAAGVGIVTGGNGGPWWTLVLGAD
jgi:uncharacterized protein YkwD